MKKLPCVLPFVALVVSSCMSAGIPPGQRSSDKGLRVTDEAENVSLDLAGDGEEG